MWANFGTLLTVDVSYYQGNYMPDGNVTGVIVNAARGNLGSYQETTWGATQVDNAKAAGKEWGVYFFNGNLDAYTCGVLFGHTLTSLGFDPTVNVLGIDCEDEGSSGTAAWGPAQCAAFVNGVASVITGLTWQGVLIYMNWDVNHRFDWSSIVSYGARLWFARPGVTGGLGQAFWSVVTMKQDGLYNGVDEDGHNATYPQIIGAVTPKKKQRRRTLVNLIIVADWNRQIYAVDNGSIRWVGTLPEYNAIKAVLYNSLDDANVPVVNAGDGSLQGILNGFGLGEFTLAQVQGMPVNSTLRAAWVDSTKAPTAPVDATALASAVSTAVSAVVPHEFTITGKAAA